MASGHVNRVNRPNTWLHRPMLQREESPCQTGAVHTWHIAAPDLCDGTSAVGESRHRIPRNEGRTPPDRPAEVVVELSGGVAEAIHLGEREAWRSHCSDVDLTKAADV